MGTQIHLVHRRTGARRSLSTKEYAAHRPDIGVRGKFRNFVHDDRSFADFRTGTRHFLREFRAALDHGQLGPAWDRMVQACSTPDGAAQLYIATARGHRPEALRAGFELMRRRGLIAHVPPVANFLPVDNPATRVLGRLLPPDLDVGARKSVAVRWLLDRQQEMPIERDAIRVRAPSGQGKLRRLSLYEFSDDDPATFRRTVADLREALRERPNRWSQIKIVIRYTGSESSEIPHRAIVLGPEGGVRPLRSEEASDYARVVAEPPRR